MSPLKALSKGSVRLSSISSHAITNTTMTRHVLALVTIFFSFLRIQTLDDSVGWDMQRRQRDEGENLQEELKRNELTVLLFNKEIEDSPVSKLVNHHHPQKSSPKRHHQHEPIRPSPSAAAGVSLYPHRHFSPGIFSPISKERNPCFSLEGLYSLYHTLCLS